MSGDRFRHLDREDARAESEVKSAVVRLTRFAQLELGAERTEARTSSLAGKVLCANCCQHNEAARESCWGCGRRLGGLGGLGDKVAPPREAHGPDITLVLDGHTYDSRDPDLPEDIRVLIERVQKRGYSPELLHEWRSWRASRSQKRKDPAVAAAAAEGGAERVELPFELFKLGGSWVIVLAGRVYRSNDSGLPPEIAEVFTFVAEHGATPEFLETLRASAGQFKVTPPRDPSQRPLRTVVAADLLGVLGRVWRVFVKPPPSARTPRR